MKRCLTPGSATRAATALASLGLFGVAEQHHEVSGGREVPRSQGSPGWLLQRPVVWLGHGDPPKATGAESTREHLYHGPASADQTTLALTRAGHRPTPGAAATRDGGSTARP